jgi:hypothetical protein
MTIDGRFRSLIDHRARMTAFILGLMSDVVKRLGDMAKVSTTLGAGQCCEVVWAGSS